MLFKAENIVKKYRNGDDYLYALNDVSISFDAEGINTILGPSGSGKTTLLNMLSGLDSLDSGRILFEGIDISNFNRKQLTKYRRENTGFIFQSYNLISTLTVRENVELAHHISKNPLDIDKVIDQVGLSEHAKKYPHQLSGGQQQRVAIARVIVKNPKVIFCDEPTGALDEKSGRSVLNLLQKLNQIYKTTLVMVTHNINIANMSNKVLYFKNGKVVDEVINETVMSAQEIEWS